MPARDPDAERARYPSPAPSADEDFMTDLEEAILDMTMGQMDYEVLNNYGGTALVLYFDPGFQNWHSTQFYDREGRFVEEIFPDE